MSYYYFFCTGEFLFLSAGSGWSSGAHKHPSIIGYRPPQVGPVLQTTYRQEREKEKLNMYSCKPHYDRTIFTYVIIYSVSDTCLYVAFQE